MIVSKYFKIDGKMYVEASDYDKILLELEKSNEKIAKLESELETKVDFETNGLVKLPFDALETANMLINATYKDKIPFLERQVYRNVYDNDDLEQIAEHLLVYCKHNREEVN